MTNRRIVVEAEPCPACGGDGRSRQLGVPENFVTCPTCHGKGDVWPEQLVTLLLDSDYETATAVLDALHAAQPKEAERG